MSGISALHAAMPETADGVICLPPGLLDRVRHYRLERVRRELRKRRVPAIVLYDPVNIRYATDTSNMQIWTGRNPTRYVMVAADGPVVGFEFHNCEHVWSDVPLEAEIRSAVCWNYFNAGPEAAVKARLPRRRRSCAQMVVSTARLRIAFAYICMHRCVHC
jgi:Xaa-Pro aminopeptidase